MENYLMHISTICQSFPSLASDFLATKMTKNTRVQTTSTITELTVVNISQVSHGVTLYLLSPCALVSLLHVIKSSMSSLLWGHLLKRQRNPLNRSQWPQLLLWKHNKCLTCHTPTPGNTVYSHHGRFRPSHPRLKTAMGDSCRKILPYLFTCGVILSHHCQGHIHTPRPNSNILQHPENTQAFRNCIILLCAGLVCICVCVFFCAYT